MDTVALQIVTVGEPASQRFDQLQSADNYSEAYYFHGLAVQAAEATATYVHQHVTRELGIPADQGKRYSWGYPACPDLEEHDAGAGFAAAGAGFEPGADRVVSMGAGAKHSGDCRASSRREILQRRQPGSLSDDFG